MSSGLLSDHDSGRRGRAINFGLMLEQAVKGFEVSGVSLCKKNSSLVPFCGFGLLHVRPHLAQF